MRCNNQMVDITSASRIDVKTKDKLLLAAEQRFLQKGYTATTVDEICSSAGATKGAFFHHFPSKEALALTVVENHGQRRFDLLTQSPDLHTDNSVQRAMAFIDHVSNTLMTIEEPACLVAALTLEMAGVNPKFKAVCAEAFERMNAFAADVFDAALSAQGVTGGPSPRALADQFIASYQGALVLARAHGQRQVIEAVIGQFRAHFRTVLAIRTPAAVQVA